MVRYILKHLGVIHSIPVFVIHSVEDVVATNGRYLFYTVKGQPTSNNPTGNFSPPFDLQDVRFGIPKETGAFHPSDEYLDVNIDNQMVSTLMHKSTALLIGFIKYPGESLNILIYTPPSEEHLYSLLYQTTFSYDTYNIKYTAITMHSTLINAMHTRGNSIGYKLTEINILNQPDGFTFELGPSSPITRVQPPVTQVQPSNLQERVLRLQNQLSLRIREVSDLWAEYLRALDDLKRQ